MSIDKAPGQSSGNSSDTSAGTTQPGRRRFLQTAAAGASALWLPSTTRAAASLRFQPAVFEPGTNSAMLWMAVDGAASVLIELSATETFANARRIPVTDVTAASEHVGAQRIDGLEPDRTFYYRILDADSGAPISRPGRFRTAPAQPRPFRFAWSADMDEAYQPFRLFDRIGERDPEFFLHLGDSIYADLPRNQFSPSPSFYRRKHANNRRDSHFQQFMLRHATFATWDDHETDNNAHAGHPHMAAARQVYREYWPCNSVAADGLYRRVSWAGVDFFMLDLRSYRSPQNDPPGPQKTMLGAAQKQWFLQALSASQAPFKFVVTSVPFQGGGEDTWFSYRAERDEISALIRKQKIGGVIFLTGDYHLARDWSNPKAAFREFMAGPIASFTHYRNTPSARDRYEKTGTFHYGDGYNFGLVSVDPATGKARVEFVDAEGKVLGAVDFTA